MPFPIVDPSIPAGITTLLARLTAARAANLDEITAARLAELDAANMPADIDTILADVTAMLLGGTFPELAYYGIVTAAAAPSFTIAGLAGLGDTKFVNWEAYVFRSHLGAGGAPQNEHQTVSSYTSVGGVFIAPAFGVVVDVGDEILILHPAIAAIYILISRLTAARAGYLDSIGDMSGDHLTNTKLKLGNDTVDLTTRLATLLADILLIPTAPALASSWTAALATALGNYTAARALVLDTLGKTSFTQKTSGAIAANGTTYVTLYDGSVITQPTEIIGFMVNVGGVAWTGLAKIRVVTAAGTKIWPAGDEVVQNTDWVSGVQQPLSFKVIVPIATGYKLQFRSSNGADNAGQTWTLNNLDVIERG